MPDYSQVPLHFAHKITRTDVGSTMLLPMSYKLAAIMNNVGVTLMEERETNCNESYQYTAAKGLFQNAWQTLNMPNARQIDGSALPQQLSVLSAWLSQSNTEINLVSPFDDQPSSSFFLVQRALTLRDTVDIDSSQTQLANAVILFNLALLHQLTAPHSRDISHLYRNCAAALVDIPDSDETFLLSVACLNNVGVWCHAAGDVAGAQSTMEQLSGLLAAEDEYDLEEPVLRGVQSNIICTLEGMEEISFLAGAA